MPAPAPCAHRKRTAASGGPVMRNWGMISTPVSRQSMTSACIVIPGLVPGIQISAGIRAGGTMDPGDKRRDDTRCTGRSPSLLALAQRRQRLLGLVAGIEGQLVGH